MKKYIYTILLLSTMSVGYGQPGKDSINNQSFDPYVATAKYINQVSPVARARSDAYFNAAIKNELEGKREDPDTTNKKHLLLFQQIKSSDYNKTNRV